MFIKKLEAQGFKSFADRTKILFHSGITAIVGPNGTGKSNIVDAILWGLGGMRLKSVRGDRTEDIIFNGNAKRPPLSLADVVITLGNEEELVISHRVFRSGESEYRLNGKAARLKDIQDELWKHSIGEKEYFVIEQGAIGSFVTSKPQEKRTLIEEAAGTAYYKDKKRQAQSKLESTEQNLIRLEDIIIEVEKSKNSLYRQALAAARYRRLRERLRELTAFHFYRKMIQLDKIQEEINSQLDQSLLQEQQLTANIKEEEKELSGKRKDLWDLEKSLKDRQERVFSLRAQLSRMESEIERESKRLEYLETARKKAESDRFELQQEIQTLEAEINGILSQLTELEKALVTQTRATEEDKNLLQEARELVRAEESSLSELRKVQMLKIQENTEARNNFSRLEKELELFLKQTEKLQQEKERLESQKKPVEARIQEIRLEIDQRLEEKKEKETALGTWKEKFSLVSQDLSLLENQLAQINREIEEISYQAEALTKIAETERDTDSQNLLPEALGWFSELVEIPQEETALFDLLWKEEAKAQACLLENFKKSLPIENKGNILLLAEKPERKVPEKLLQEEGVLGLLKKKIKVRPDLEKYLGSLEEAVIVKDIMTAVRLWELYPEFNFISLNGDLLHSPGLLRIGQKKEGLFGLSQEKKKLEKEIERLEALKRPLLQKIDLINKEKQQLEVFLQEAQNQLAAIERTLYDLPKEKNFAETELEKIATNLNILRKEEKIQQEEKDNLSQKKQVALSELQKTDSGLEEIKEKIRQKEDVLIKLKEKERTEEQNYYQVKSQRDLLQEKINSTKTALQSLEKRQQAIKNKLGILEMEVFASNEEKANLSTLIEELKQKSAILSEEARKEEEDLVSFEQKVQGQQKQLEELESRLNEAREIEEKAREERMKLEIRKAEIERDRVNLEETCWQELKKNLIELKQEIEGSEQPVQEPAENEEISRALAEEGEPEESGAEIEEKAEEKPKERRRGKPSVPARELSDEELEKELEATREARQRYRAVNLMAEEEYLEQKKRYDFLIQQRQDLRDSINSTQEAIKKIDEESKAQFLKALEEVNKNFQQVFALLFRGGTAEVKLLEPDNPLESGVEIIAQPPGKRVQNLTLLSGGEKSLISLAFLFALFRYKPSPFCILDEVDAALDEVNLARFLNLMKAIKHQTQFIIITHNYKSMEVADYIYGTTMEEPNITKVYSVRMEKKEEAPLKEENVQTAEALPIENSTEEATKKTVEEKAEAEAEKSNPEQ